MAPVSCTAAQPNIWRVSESAACSRSAAADCDSFSSAGNCHAERCWQDPAAAEGESAAAATREALTSPWDSTRHEDRQLPVRCTLRGRLRRWPNPGSRTLLLASAVIFIALQVPFGAADTAAQTMAAASDLHSSSRWDAPGGDLLTAVGNSTQTAQAALQTAANTVVKQIGPAGLPPGLLPGSSRRAESLRQVMRRGEVWDTLMSMDGRQGRSLQEHSNGASPDPQKSATCDKHTTIHRRIVRIRIIVSSVLTEPAPSGGCVCTVDMNLTSTCL